MQQFIAHRHAEALHTRPEPNSVIMPAYYFVIMTFSWNLKNVKPYESSFNLENYREHIVYASLTLFKP